MGVSHRSIGFAELRSAQLASVFTIRAWLEHAVRAEFEVRLKLRLRISELGKLVSFRPYSDSSPASDLSHTLELNHAFNFNYPRIHD